MESAAYTIKKCNPLEKAIFYKISSSGPLSKPDLLKQLNLKHATLSRAVDSLLEKGLLEQIAAGESSSIGRKPKLLSVNPNSFYLLGVDISRMYLGIILTNARMQKIEYTEYALNGSITPEFIIDKISSFSTCLLEKHSIDKNKVLGLGIGAVGKLEKSDGIIIYADNFGSEWYNIPIRERLQDRLGIQVILENGANAAVFSEFLMGSARGFNHVLFVNIGIGIRCGLINDGRIIKNINNIDSTYGHIVIEPSGKKCSCGNYGCLVMYSTTRAIVEDYIKMCKLKNLNISQDTFENMRFESVANFFETGDLIAGDAITNASIYMGIGLANIASILNPEIIVLGGPIVERSELYFNKVIDIARSRIFRVEDRNITFTKSHFERKAVSIGMCAMMLQKHFITPNNSL